MGEREFLERVARFVELVPLCPRLSLGISLPRESFLLLQRRDSLELLNLRTRLRVGEELSKFSQKVLPTLDVDGFLTRSESPFCGVLDAKVFDSELRPKERDDGLFTRWIRKYHPLLPVESHRRLQDYEVRRLFLARLFSLAELRETLGFMRSERELVEFHRRYKYLLMLHSPQHLKLLGNIVANREERPLEEVKSIYRLIFMETLAKSPSRRSYANVFLHLYGHMKRRLEEREKELLRQQIKGYAEGRRGLRSLFATFLEMLQRQGNAYALSQRFFQPYPPELEVEETARA
ncbi:MAG: DUF1722 domain-containing protein [Acidilobaceae archaeon]